MTRKLRRGCFACGALRQVQRSLASFFHPPHRRLRPRPLCLVILLGAVAGCISGGATLSLSASAGAVPTPASEASHAVGAPERARPDNANFHFIGHWDLSGAIQQAVTVNSGSRILCSFTGESVTGLFGTEGISSPAQIYVRIDGGKLVRFTADRAAIDFAQGLASGRHTFELEVKDVDERVNRWKPPLQAALIFKGLQLSPGGHLVKSPLPGKVRMEFYGDSITQGVRIDSMAIGPDGSDGTKDYAFLVALAFNALHNQVGFGRQGIIRAGNGNVPPAPDSFGWNYQDSPSDPAFVPSVVVVNQGTNDGSYKSAEFEPAYRGYIALIRRRDPKATILCLRPFGGFHADDIQQAVRDLGNPKVIYVDTTGWLDKSDYTDGVHPNAGGQIKAAERLIEVIHEKTGLKPARTAASVAADR
ncbi:MAG TPA: SGNH/GDSL hydrolase family protein [Terriglobia bacterium]|nr:SGNH/GDSL hydrolase family protein [Terriglobia bacterium]